MLGTAGFGVCMDDSKDKPGKVSPEISCGCGVSWVLGYLALAFLGLT
jgi:hypothetical protein